MLEGRASLRRIATLRRLQPSRHEDLTAVTEADELLQRLGRDGSERAVVDAWAAPGSDG